jgi:hypothetical protein
MWTAPGFDAMNLKNRLRDIESDGRNRLHDLTPVEEPSSALAEATALRLRSGADGTL